MKPHAEWCIYIPRVAKALSLCYMVQTSFSSKTNNKLDSVDLANKKFKSPKQEGPNVQFHGWFLVHYY